MGGGIYFGNVIYSASNVIWHLEIVYNIPIADAMFIFSFVRSVLHLVSFLIQLGTF